MLRKMLLTDSRCWMKTFRSDISEYIKLGCILRSFISAFPEYGIEYVRVKDSRGSIYIIIEYRDGHEVQLNVTDDSIPETLMEFSKLINEG